MSMAEGGAGTIACYTSVCYHRSLRYTPTPYLGGGVAGGLQHLHHQCNTFGVAKV
jgi:hypothetical protein